ncbi:Crp/Fnr family transcriptional regulator [Chryseobacterium sp. R2A-55]|uniref:Crp/Fnr family transcriptional regulator n=1 Tax=Chryseobacterium sp. R2A-55 TaxID=2744445 RepID=UPI001F2E5801|nr:Crp/Fnr family transcriptional regulator [Chryseobacterium sp. R2A-55]
MDGFAQISEKLAFIGADFLSEFGIHAVQKSVDAKTELMRVGQNVKYIPIVASGLIKVYGLVDEKEFLYYYVRAGQSCIMTFSSIFDDQQSKVFAVSEEASEIILLPVTSVRKWLNQYPEFNHFFYRQYELRYSALIEMLNQAIFHRLDKRILEYLNNRMTLLAKDELRISHKEIANDVGTAREVVSRILKKFENEGVITQTSSVIKFRRL